MSHNSQKAFPDGYPISEKKARGQIGVTRDEMRALRNKHLTEGTHYARGKQQSVWLNAAGLDCLLKAIAPTSSLQEKRAATPNARECDPVKAQLLSLLTERIATLQKTPESRQLRVVSANLQFKHMLIACALDDDHFRPAQPLRVRVNNNANFVRGMEIPVQLVAGYTDLFELTRKCPRQKGKW
jgi:hypothetical protein